MLVFIVPLKSAQVSTSWERVSQLFERCIKSICNQSSANFRVIVVCHEKPYINFENSHIQYIEVSFPTPDKLDLRAKRIDRGRKVLTGLKYAQDFEQYHTMVVDADDCVSRYLAEFIEQNNQGSGWFFNKGYEYKNGSKFIYLRKNNFYLHCGTSNIIRHDFCQFPEDPETLGEESLLSYAIPHPKIINIMKKRGAMLLPLPFVGAVYVINNGENNYKRESRFLKGLYNYKEATLIAKEVYRGINSKFVTRAIRNEFGLYDIRP